MEQLNKLSLGEKLVCGGTLVLIIAALFFQWWSFLSAGYDGFSAPGGTWITLAVLVAVAMSGLILATKLGNMQMPAAPTNWTWGMIYAIGGGLVVLFVLLKAWRITAAPIGGFDIGFFLGAIGTGLIAYGCYLLYSADKGGGFGALRR
jgi:hypothetical protein